MEGLVKAVDANFDEMPRVGRPNDHRVTVHTVGDDEMVNSMVDILIGNPMLSGAVKNLHVSKLPDKQRGVKLP